MTAREVLNPNDRFRLLEERLADVSRELERLRERRSQRNVMKQVRIHLAFVDNEITGATEVQGKVKLGTGVVTLYRRDVDSEDARILHHVENGTKDGGEKARVYNACTNRIAVGTGTGTGVNTGTGTGEQCKLVIIVEDKFGDLYVVKECDAPCPPSVTGTGTTGTGSTGTGSTGTTGTGTGTTGTTGTGSTGTTGTGTGTGTGTTGTGTTGTGQTGTGTATGTGTVCGGSVEVSRVKCGDGNSITITPITISIRGGELCVNEGSPSDCITASCCPGTGSVNTAGTPTPTGSPI